MLSPGDFKRKYQGGLAEKLPDRPISSLRDIQYLYGRLYTLGTAGGGEYADYLTPGDADDLLGSEESLIAVRVDLTGDEPRLDADKSVFVTQYTDDLTEAIAHCKYSAAKGIDHSVTHRSGRNSSPEKLARYAVERLTKWATDDVVQDVADAHEDGHLIDALAAVGADDENQDRIRERVQDLLGGSRTALLTVQIKRPGDNKYQWPGDIDAFLEAMRARKLSKLVSKNEATESAGQATDMVTDVAGRTVGTADDPLNYFLGKQMEKFPGLDPDQAWRNHPISEDAAVTVMNAKEFVDACSFSTFNASVYYLPYFLGRPTPEDAFELYRYLYRSIENDDMSQIRIAYDEFSGDIAAHESRLRFYVAAVMKHQMSLYDVYGETLNGRLYYPTEVATQHADIVRSWAFDEDDPRNAEISPPLPSYEDAPLTTKPPFEELVASGRYVYETFPFVDDDTDASADDRRIDTFVSILAGDPIDRDLLISAYVERLLDWRGDGFPSLLVASQFAQLAALSNAELVTAREGQTEQATTDGPTYDTTMDTTDPHVSTDGGTTALNRSEKLESFIEETPALGDTERRGAFLIGTLVGQIGTYQQYHHDRSTTVIDQYPIKSMTKTKIKRITQEVLDKDIVYTREAAKQGSSITSTMYREVTDKLVETMAKNDPEEWTIGTDDLRFYYALGVTYGMNDRSTNTDETTENTNE